MQIHLGKAREWLLSDFSADEKMERQPDLNESLVVSKAMMDEFSRERPSPVFYRADANRVSLTK